MGENKGHGEKSPSYPELDQMGSTASRAGQSAGNQQDTGRPDEGGNRQSGQAGIGQQQDVGSRQSGSQQSGSQRSGSKQGGSGQAQNQQKGGQHASGGTPALDDLNAPLDSRNKGSLGNASQQMDQQDGWQGQQDKNR